METRLTHRDRWLIAALLAGAAIMIAVGAVLFPRAFPEAAIDFAVDRAASRARAEQFLRDLGYDFSADLHADRFLYDDETKTFLERELGLASADSAFAGELRLWRWAHRWFRPREEESFRVAIATSGELAFFEHVIPEEASRESLSAEDALARAQEFLREMAQLDPAHFTLVGAEAKIRPARTDRTFTWQRIGRNWAGAPLRAQVIVQGDRIGGFALFLQIPEKWERDYLALRSRNETTGSVATVAYGVILLGIAAAFARRATRGEIAWRTALGFAAAAVVLYLLRGLNGLRDVFFDYDTHESLGSFAAQRAVVTLLQSVGAGLVIFILTAGAEAVYRRAYPAKISLGGYFTRQGLRTRGFFFAILAGYALAAAFFAYQAAFYCVAAAFGAWAPADVPYSNLLNTTLPWAFVLLTGFFPAVSEEFSARMFAIPWLTRSLRSRAAAVVLAAAIWGFAHAGYPNEPFYIRGFEVGLAGIAIGFVMLRVNVLAVLVWHYTVDAFYAAYLLLRSGNAYLAISGGIAAGVLMVPFIYALAAYLRSGRFESPQGIRNADVAGPLVLPAPRPVPARRVDFAPLSAKRALAALLIAVTIAAGVYFLPAASFRGLGEYRVSAGDVRRAAREQLAAIGAPLESLRVAVWPRPLVADDDCRYAASVVGPDRAARFLQERIGARGWVARAFAPLRSEEWRVTLDGQTGDWLGFEHYLAETAPGDSLPQDVARDIAGRFLAERGYDLARWTLAEASSEPRPNRADHVFVWEGADSTLRLGQGAARVRVGVWGSQVGEWRRYFKIPDEWLRARENRTPFDIARIGLLVALLIALVAYCWRALAGETRLGPIAWRRGLTLGAIVAIAGLCALFVNWDRMAAGYDTSAPWQLFLLQYLLLGAFGLLILGLAIGAGLALAPVVHARVGDALARPNRTRSRRSALFALLMTVIALVAVSRVSPLLASLLPGDPPPIQLEPPIGLGSAVPLIPALAAVARDAGIAAILVSLAIFVMYRDGRVRPLGVALLAIGAVVLVPSSARTSGEILAAMLAYISVFVAGALLARYVLRDHAPAYALACILVGASRVLWELAGNAATRLVALELALCIAIIVAVLLANARARSLPPQPFIEPPEVAPDAARGGR